MVSLKDRLVHAWNAFRDPTSTAPSYSLGSTSFGMRPDRTRLSSSPERSISASIYTRIGIDVAKIPVRHVRLDQNGSYIETIQSGLNECLTVSSNIDQIGTAFFQDAAMSLCDEGAIAIVAVDTTINPAISNSFDVQSLRVGSVVEWFPRHVKVSLYNDVTGLKEELILEKRTVAIVENPLYAVMNEPNSTMKRLVYKLALLDAIDQQSSSGKLDLIIQLPYVVKTQARREQALARREAIEEQLSGSKYGVAYTDGTEKITQLNRPAENNLMGQIEYLTRMLYGQLGITEEVLLGTADEKTMNNYHSRTIEPILSAITGSMTRTYLTKTARTQGQAVRGFRNPFEFISAETFATSVDTFTRNAVLSSNEVRAVMGLKKSDDPDADKLRNKNLNESVPSASGQNQSSDPVQDQTSDLNTSK